MSTHQLPKSPTTKEKILYTPRNARTQRPPAHSSSNRAPPTQQTMPSTYFTHLANAEIPSLFQEIASIRANTGVYVARSAQVQTVRPDQILRTQHDTPSNNPCDVLQYHLSSVTGGETQRRNDGLLTSHHPSGDNSQSPPIYSQGHLLDQYTSPGQPLSWDDFLPMGSLHHENISFTDHIDGILESPLPAGTNLLNSSPKTSGIRSSKASATLNMPHVDVQNSARDLNLGDGQLSPVDVAYMPPSSHQLFHDPAKPGLQEYIEAYVKRQIMLDPSYGEEFRRNEVVDLTGAD